MTQETSLNGILHWIDTVGSEPATTLARFEINLGTLPIWPIWGDDETDLEIFVDDLLSYLTSNWDVLLLEEVYPHGLTPDQPSRLRAFAEWQLSRGPRNAQSERVMASTIEFAKAHDLSRCFGGLYDLPAFWMMRQGSEFVIETSDRLKVVSFTDWVAFVTGIGDQIAARLMQSNDKKWHSLVAAWENRDQADPFLIAKLSTGQPNDVVRKLIAEKLIPSTQSVLEAANDNDGLRIAARLIGTMPYQSIRDIMSAAKSVSYLPSDELNKLRNNLSAAMSSLPGNPYPYEQGVRAANWVRQQRGLAGDARADPITTLGSYGVQLLYQSIGPSVLDALAIWGDAHGPAVIFNQSSRRLNFNGNISQRTLKIVAAHELCHLILDYRRTVAEIDISDGRVTTPTESRANAFAAEFMLPARTAFDLWRHSDLPQNRDGISRFISRLSDRYDVSKMVANWQFDHGLNGSNPEIAFVLAELRDRR